MAIKKTWEIIDEELKEIETSMVEASKKEQEHLEKWITAKPFRKPFRV